MQLAVVGLRDHHFAVALRRGQHFAGHRGAPDQVTVAGVETNDKAIAGPEKKAVFVQAHATGNRQLQIRIPHAPAISNVQRLHFTIGRCRINAPVTDYRLDPVQAVALAITHTGRPEPLGFYRLFEFFQLHGLARIFVIVDLEPAFDSAAASQRQHTKQQDTPACYGNPHASSPAVAAARLCSLAARVSRLSCAG